MKKIDKQTKNIIFVLFASFFLMFSTFALAQNSDSVIPSQIAFQSTGGTSPDTTAATTDSIAENCKKDPNFSMQNGFCLPKSAFNCAPGGIACANSLFDVIGIILKVLLTIVGVIAVLWLIIAGFQYMTAGGNEEQAEKARKAITNAVIGLMVVILSYAIVTVITKFLTNGDITK